MQRKLILFVKLLIFIFNYEINKIKDTIHFVMISRIKFQ